MSLFNSNQLPTRLITAFFGHSWLRFFFLIAIISPTCEQPCFSQGYDITRYVNPFIGTANSAVLTKWGNEGGTYPGAVSPWGFIQLSPETRANREHGYHYTDHSICYFSCFSHSSGFPSGSAGRVMVMPIDKKNFTHPASCSRPFSHADEWAEPGYYCVRFSDDGTCVESIALPRTGVFRFSFPARIAPAIFISDAGEISFPSDSVIHAQSYYSTLFKLSIPFEEKERVDGGFLLHFKKKTSAQLIILKLSISNIDLKTAEINLDKECARETFDKIRIRVKDSWNKALSVITVKDTKHIDKIIFYTALYHSLLIPWVIDDVDGNYRGQDAQIHRSSGKHEYGQFSPWDSFRSLHPLLCLIYPMVEQDMILSMLDVYKQTGHLPIESMTGNHAVSIITDSYLKGITGFDPELAYSALKAGIVKPPYAQEDLEVYNSLGYIPSSYPESVTRTVEYAYDDWAIGQFAKQLMNRDSDYISLSLASLRYRNLFEPQQGLMLPREQDQFKMNPGNSGYKEGDAFVYSYFVPQNPRDLINLMGGNRLFAKNLNARLKDGRIVFDNETVFHIPYLFNEAGYPALTQYWVRRILNTRFDNSPGGLPGNDDLGAVSSWYVLSAMGIYPLCPGKPLYTISLPLFRETTIHLFNGKSFLIKNGTPDANQPHIKSLQLNNKVYVHSWISHRIIQDGATMIFNGGNLDAAPNIHFPEESVFSETKASSDFSFFDFSVSKTNLKSNEIFWLRFSAINKSSMGAKQILVYADNKPIGSKMVALPQGGKIRDSVACTLFAYGQHFLRFAEGTTLQVSVEKPRQPVQTDPLIADLMVKPLLDFGQQQEIRFSIRNLDGYRRIFQVPVKINDSVLAVDKISLSPGEKRELINKIAFAGYGFRNVEIAGQHTSFKIVDSNRDALILDLPMGQIQNKQQLKDYSGFGNDGEIVADTQHTTDISDSALLFGPNVYVEIPNSHSADLLGQQLTMMLWVYPTRIDGGLVDIFSKGDNHVIQLTGGNTISFFAGGWSRGDCNSSLPANWLNHWHHIAGVCYPEKWQLYMDGNLIASTDLESAANLTVANKWTLGRNEEFPGKRIFNGYIRKARVFAKALTAQEIKCEMIR